MLHNNNNGELFEPEKTRPLEIKLFGTHPTTEETTNQARIIYQKQNQFFQKRS